MNNPPEREDYTDRFLSEWRTAWPELKMDEAEPLIRVIRLAGVLDRALVVLAKEFGINTGQFQVLAALRRRYPQALSPSDLSRFAILTSGTMTILLDRLEDKGLVTRNRLGDDRRRVDIALTPAGMALIDDMLVQRSHTLRSMAGEVGPEERAGTSATLKRLLLAFDRDL